jgi:Raf kinase inhibitor-like YbhB/YbcL family protein
MLTTAHVATGLASLIVLALAAGCGGDDESPSPPGGGTDTGAADEPAADLTVESSAFAEGEPIPAEHTCEGANTSPPLSWSGLPEGTQSVAIWLDDPDAPGGAFTHWLAWDLDPGAGGVDAGQAAPVEGANDAGENGYFGPCPPGGDGPHRYVFHVYALDLAELGLPAGSDAAALRAALEGHILAEGEYSGTFER